MTGPHISRSSFDGIRVGTRDQKEVELVDLFGSRTNLIIFLRHFGCIGCTQQVNELVPRLTELANLGVEVLLVGSGTPDFISEFMQRHNLVGTSVRICTDPELLAYRAAGFGRSAWATFGPRSLARRLRAAGKGATGYRGTGDLLQQGGALVLGPEGEAAMRFESRGVGDNVDLNDVVDVVLRLEGVELSGVV